MPKYALVRTVSMLMLRPSLELLFPRALLIIARFSQTFLMTAVIHYLETPKNERNPNRAYGLIAITALCFYGDAVADSLFRQKHNRVFTALRGGLTSLIYENSLSTTSGDSELTAVTIMSNDIDIILGNTSDIFDIPAYLVETIVGLWLLWRQLGLVSLAPIILLAICSYLQTIVGKFMSDREVAWTKAVQKRVGLTSNILRSMKSVKMTGLVGVSAKLVQEERIKELKLAKKLSWSITWLNIVCKFSSQYSLSYFNSYK
jgi:ATP-binding cassette subfamily C (CFTR/MRP) protein 1